MFRLSKLTDYATVVATAMAREPDRVHSASDLAQRVGLELPTASKVLKLLAREGLVESFRGAQGGYKLARAPQEITMADLITAIEGPFGMTECSIHAGSCAQEPVCSIASNWQRISRAVESALRQLTVADMTGPVNPMTIELAAPAPLAAQRP